MQNNHRLFAEDTAISDCRLTLLCAACNFGSADTTAIVSGSHIDVIREVILTACV